METPEKKPTTSHNSQSSPVTPRKVELMSHEDLVKTNKKQLVFLQKLKVKCDELQAKLSKQSDYAEVKQQHAELNGKNIDLEKEVEQLQEKEKKLLKIKSAGEEEFNCLKQKQETLLSSLQCLQLDFDDVTKIKQELNNKLENSITENQKLQKLIEKHKTDLEDANVQVEDKHHQLVSLKNYIKSLAEKEKNLTESKLELADENKKIKNELAALKISLDMFKNTKNVKDSKDSEKIKNLTATIDDLKSNHANISNENGVLIQKVHDITVALTEKDSELKDALDKSSNVSNQLSQCNTMIAELQKEFAVAQQELINIRDAKVESEKVFEAQNTELKMLYKSQLKESKKLENLLQEKYNQITAENSSLKKEIQHLQDSLSQYEKKDYDNLLQQVKDLRENLSVSENDLVKTKEKLSETLEKNKNLNESIDKNSHKIQCLLDQLEDKQSELQNYKMENESTITVLQSKLDDANFSVNKLNLQCNDLKATNESIQSQMKLLQDDESIARISIEEEAKNKESEIQARCDFLQSECLDLKNKLQTYEHDGVAKEKIDTLEAECNSLKKQTDHYQEELLQTKKLLDDKTAIYDELSNKFVQLQESEQNLDGPSREIKAISELNLNYNISLAELNSLKNELSNEKLKHEDEVKILQKSQSEWKVKAKRFEEDCVELREKICSLEKQNQGYYNDYEMKQKQLEDIETAMSHLQAQNSDLQNHCSALEEKLAFAVNEHSSKDSLINESQQINILLEQKLTKLGDELTSKNNEIKELLVNATEFHKTVETLKIEISEKNESLFCTNDKLNEFKNEIVAKTNQCNILESQCNQVEDKNKLLIERIESMQKQLEDADKSLLTNSDKLKHLEIQHNEKEVLLNTLQMQLEAKDLIKEKLQSSIDSASIIDKDKDKKLSDFENLLYQKNKLIKEQEATIQNLNTALNDTKAVLSDAESSFHSKLTDVESALNKAESDLVDIKQKNCHFLNENNKLKESLANLKDEILSKEILSKQLQDTNAELNNKVECLCNEKRSLEEQLEELNNKAISASSKLPDCEVETLQKSLQNKESYAAKLKLLAVKARKELDTTKQQLQDVLKEKNQLQNKISDLNTSLLESQARVMSSAQTLQNECDRFQDEIDKIKEQKIGLQKLVDESKAHVSATNSQKEEMNARLTAALSDVEKTKAEKNLIENQLSSSKSQLSTIEKQRDNLIKEKTSLCQELEAVKIQLESTKKMLDEKQEKLNSAEASLAQTNQQLQQHDLMSLEMAQYEATLCGLQTQVSDFEKIVRGKDEKIEELKMRISELNEDRKATENLRLDAESRVNKTNETLHETRLQIAQLSETEHELKSQVSSLNEQYEQYFQQCEEFKLDLATKSSECRKLEEKISQMEIMNKNSVDKLKKEITNKKDEIEKLRKDNESIKNDYEKYKIRAQSVLKQQKGLESLKYQRQDDQQMKMMKAKLSEMREKMLPLENALSERDNEVGELQAENERLIKQHQEFSESSLERESLWKSRVKMLQQELSSLRKQHDNTMKKLSKQDEILAASISATEENCEKKRKDQVALLENDLKKKDDEIMALRSEIRKRDEKQTVNDQPLPSSAHHRHHVVTEANVDYRSMAREEGEGEEYPDDLATSFEQLLKTPVIPSNTTMTDMSDGASLVSEVNFKQLESKLVAQTKQLEHSTEIARESESNALRLAEQNKVLKDEIRRLEKNQEREKSVANMEYLKNVIYKFLTLPPSDEKRHLVPVMDTMLRLSKEERMTIETLAEGDESPEEQKPAGWGSYLQRWSGMN